MTRQFAQPAERIAGAAMDQPLPRRRGRRAAIAAGVLAGVLAGAFALWQWMPRGLQVPEADLRRATVTRGMFRDDVVLRATAAPLHSVMLDAVESGRVEEVFARDGALVKQGEVLFRLSNPQRRLELLARESERAQQISNLLNLRVALEASRAGRQRRLADLSFALVQAEKQHGRSLALAQKGFMSAAALEDSADRLAQQRRLFDAEKTSNETETAIQRNAIAQMEQAIARLEAGLELVNSTVEALAVRAPVAGSLTDFRLQVGETVKPGQRIGRIDDPAQFKLSANVEEYYLNRVALGRKGSVVIHGRTHALTVSRIYPQITEGRFTLELAFDNAQPQGLKPGQGTEAYITLGATTDSVLLPIDSYINDSGGLWAFVVSRDGKTAERRAIRTGRRNNSQVELLSGLVPGEQVIVSSYASYGKAERLQFNK